MDLQTRIKTAVNDALSKAVATAVDEHYKVTKTDTAVVRQKKIGKTATYTEMFPLRIEHVGSESGRSATVSIDGCSRRFKVEQDMNRPQHKRPWQTALPYVPRWNVTLNGQLVETNEDFDSAVQQCVLALIGHVYYDGVK